MPVVLVIRGGEELQDQGRDPTISIGKWGILGFSPFDL